MIAQLSTPVRSTRPTLAAWLFVCVLGATIAALVFRAAPREAEHVCLLVAVGLAVAGGLASLSRMRTNATPAS